MDHAVGLTPDGSSTAYSPVVGGFLIFRPGASKSSGNVVLTWPEVQEAIAQANGALTILVDDSLAAAVVPATGTLVTDCKHAVTLSPFNPKSGTKTQLEIADTAQLLNLAGIKGPLLLLCDSHTVSSLNFTYSTPSVFQLSEFCTIKVKTGALLSPIVVPTGDTFFLSTSDGPTFDNSAAESVGIISLTGTATCSQYAVGGFNFGTTPVKGVSGSTWTLERDGTIGIPTLTGFSGTFTTNSLFGNFAPVANSVLSVNKIAGEPPPSPMSNSPVMQQGTIYQCGAVLGTIAFAAGESVVIDIHVNGNSILAAPFTLDNSTSIESFIDQLGNVANNLLLVGNEIVALMTYTPGGTPNSPNFSLVILWG